MGRDQRQGDVSDASFLSVCNISIAFLLSQYALILILAPLRTTCGIVCLLC